jgi:hypothetical protein
LFWKSGNDTKKTKENTKIFKAPSDSRTAFRVAPSPQSPMYLKAAGENLAVLDISSGGFSFEGPHFKVGSIHPIQFTLPNEKVPIFATMEVLRIENKIVRAKLYDLSKEQEDRVHHYVLNRQKEEIEEKKKKERDLAK